MTQLGLAARAGRTALSRRLQDLDLHAGQDALLLALGEEDKLSLRELAQRLAVQPPTITKTLSRLVAQGRVEKRPSATDARQSHACLTSEGKALVEEVREARARVERTALRGFSPKETKSLRKLLRRVSRNLAADGSLTDAGKAELDG